MTNNLIGPMFQISMNGCARIGPDSTSHYQRLSCPRDLAQATPMRRRTRLPPWLIYVCVGCLAKQLTKHGDRVALGLIGLMHSVPEYLRKTKVTTGWVRS